MTSPQQQYEIVPDEIRGHAGTVAVVADELAAVASRMPSGIGDDALGTFASFIAGGLGAAMTQVASATDHASTAVDELSSGLSRTAAAYQGVEQHNATTLTREYPA